MDYPRFLSTKPEGVDLYAGKSQEKLAADIRRHIVQIDSLEEVKESPVIPRIIGLEGAWGLGKSNVISKMQDEMCEDYIFYTYDAWAYQEDLQRRSFLEGLTDELIHRHAESINPNTKLTLLKETDKDEYKLTVIECTWEERVEALVSRKSQTRNYAIPHLNNDTKLFILFLLLSGIIPSIVNAIKTADWAIYVAPSLCLGLILLLWSVFVAILGKDKSRWKKMWAFYQTSSASETTTFTIAQEEPTEKEFRSWMQDLNDSLKGKRLVVVFDNMDRLPAEKVKTLWSTIHTFFAGKGYDRIWSIIPFDGVHLAKAYGSVIAGDDAKVLCQSFIDKTFPIVYHVPEAVITDYRMVVSSLIERAFGNVLSIEEKDAISRIYRLEHTKPNVRNIISFINELVLLSQRWGNQISVENIALFVLNRNIIAEKSESLLSVEYLGKFGKLYEDSSTRKTEVAALYYGVDKVVAAQLPMKRFLQDVLTNSENISEYKQRLNEYAAENDNFYDVLEELLRELEYRAYLPQAVSLLNILDVENPSILKDWSLLAREYCKTKDLIAQADDEYVLSLISKCAEIEAKKVKDEYLLRIKLSVSNNQSGDVVYLLLNRVRLAIKKSYPNWKFDCPHLVLNAEQFVDYVIKGREDYASLPVSCDKKKLSDYLIKLIESKKDVLDVLGLLKNDTHYTLTPIFEFVKGKVTASDTPIADLDYMFNHLRASATQLIEFDSETIPNLVNTYNSLLSNSVNHSSILDLYVILIKSRQDISVLSEKRLTGLESIIWKYITFSDLANIVATRANSLPNSLLNYCINNSVVSSEVIDNSILQKLNPIRNAIGCTISSLIKYLELYQFESSEEFEVDLQTVFPTLDWLNEFVKSDSVFANLVKNCYSICVERLEITSLCETNGRLKSNNYWVGVVDVLFEIGMYKRNLPVVLKQVAGRLIEAIASDVSFHADTEKLSEGILETVQYRDISTSVDNALNTLLRNQPITKSKFVKLHKWFEATNVNDNSDSGAFLNRVINPILGESDFQTIVCSNEDFYLKLFNGHLDSDSTLKNFLVAVKEGKMDALDSFKTFVTRVNIIMPLEEE